MVFDVYTWATKGTPVPNVMSVGDRSSMSASDPERLAKGLRFLSSASRALAASFDYVATLKAVADLTVPAYAAGLTVEIDDEGTPSIACTAGAGAGPRGTKFPLVARERAVGALRVVAAGKLDALDHEIL